ncbi:DNA recombinase [Chitinimonas arctica]|uniref:DNA recombinase n=1 Tax=Chitinimonas arctica TaxID=2594795 RepID=A0A516SL22_9NEIS|nr:DNA recombinase [Chitinimonas arctica]
MILRRWTDRGGLDGPLAAHSLRSGFFTSAAEHGDSLQRIIEVTLQTDPRTVLGYTRRSEMFRDHAGERFL